MPAVPNLPVDGALEYRLGTDSLIPLLHPVGELIGQDAWNGLLCGASDGFGSMLPAFCRAYVKNTGRKVIAVHAAKGATTVSQWQKGTERYAALCRKSLGAIQKVRETGACGHIYFVWLQGESDAIERTDEQTYISRMIALKDALKADIGIERFGIIGVGYFCGVVDWLEDGRSKAQGMADDEVIMRAQDKLPAIDGDFVMLTNICRKLSLDASCINPDAAGHYNNKAMEKIGAESAVAFGMQHAMSGGSVR